MLSVVLERKKMILKDFLNVWSFIFYDIFINVWIVSIHDKNITVAYYTSSNIFIRHTHVHAFQKLKKTLFIENKWPNM